MTSLLTVRTALRLFLAFLLALLGAATAEELSELPSGLLILPFAVVEIWLLGGAMVKVLRE